MAALEIGLDVATLSAVGKRLGVDHSSLYRHIDGREDMLLGAVDHAIGSVTWDAVPNQWRAYLENVAQAAWDLYMRYPGLAETVRRLVATPPKMIATFAEVCRQLEAFGFAAEDTVLIVDSIMDMTCDSAAGWRWMEKPAGDSGTVADSMRRSWQAAAAERGGLDEHVSAMTEIIAGDPEAWWRQKLDILLDGAATRLGACP